MSFTIPLCKAAVEKEIPFVYLNEAESEEPIKSGEKGCPGTSGEPNAKPGFWCVFQGGAIGTKESLWKNVKKPPLSRQAAGNENLNAGEYGGLMVWRTGEYPGTTPVKLAKEDS